MSEPKYIQYEELSGGIDRTDGRVSRDARKLYDLENYYLSPGGKLTRRPPAIRLTGDLDANTQGLAFLNGVYITIAKAVADGGPVITHTISGATVNTLYFDNPEYCTDWELIDLDIYNGNIIATIKHTYPSSVTDNRIMLHVWDKLRPTWVDDSAVPTNWTKQFPQQPYGKPDIDAPGAARTYTPRIGISGDKAFMSTASGNTAFSASERPRVWSDRSGAQILLDGRWWYWIAPTTAFGMQVTIPALYSDLVLDARYAAYVCEYLATDGTWVQFLEKTLPVVLGEYGISPVTDRFNPANPDQTRLTINTQPGRVIRFRAMAKAPVQVQTGCYLAPDGTIIGGTVTHEGASVSIATVKITPLVALTEYAVMVTIPGAPIAVATSVAAASGTMPLNGQQRYWSRIIAFATTDGAGAAFVFTYTGTVTVTVNSKLVVGVGTTFLTQAKVGQTLEVNGERRVIVFVNTDLLLEVDSPFTATAAGQTMLRDVRYRYASDVGNTGNEWYAEREAEATFTLSGENDAGFLNTSLYNTAGSLPVAVSPGQNRLFVVFSESIQMWQTDPDPTNMRHLATQGGGAENNTKPKLVQVDDQTIIPTAFGPRMFAPHNEAKDYISNRPIGDRLRGLALPNFLFAVWWPFLRTYITAGTDGVLWVLTYHPQQRIAAWAKWQVAGLTLIDAMTVRGNQVGIRSGTKLWQLDPDQTVFRDTLDGATAYVSRALTLWNDFGQPARNKRLKSVDISQDGTSRINVFMSPYVTDDYAVGPSISGYSQGQQKYPVMAMGPALALEISSTDETGHTLNVIGLSYLLLDR